MRSRMKSSMKSRRQSGLLMAAFAITALGACSQLQQREAAIDPYLIRIRELEQRLASLEQQKTAVAQVAARTNANSQDFALMEQLRQQDEEVRRLQGEVEMARYQRQLASQNIPQRPLPDANRDANRDANAVNADQPLVPPMPVYRGNKSDPSWPSAAVEGRVQRQQTPELAPLSVGVGPSAPPVQIVAPGTSSSSWPVVGSARERVIEPTSVLPEPELRGGALLSAEAVPIQEVFRTASGSDLSAAQVQPEANVGVITRSVAETPAYNVNAGYDSPLPTGTTVVTVEPNTIVPDPDYSSGYDSGYQQVYTGGKSNIEPTPAVEAQIAQAEVVSSPAVFDEGSAVALPEYAAPITSLSAQKPERGRSVVRATAKSSIESDTSSIAVANFPTAKLAPEAEIPAANTYRQSADWPQVVVPEPKLSDQRVDSGEPALASYQGPVGSEQVATGFVEFGGERDRYRAAYEALQERRYQQAMSGFQGFVRDHPKSDYADNAQYWLGESYYVTRDFDNALLEFSRVIENYPTSTKVADAQLKIGYVYYEQQRWALARQTLESVGYEHSGTRAAELASERLQRLEREGY